MIKKLQVSARTRIIDPDKKSGLIEDWWFQFFQLIAKKAQFIGEGNVTAAATGSATALPANPAGYQTVVVNGVEYLVPYYNKP